MCLVSQGSGCFRTKARMYRAGDRGSGSFDPSAPDRCLNCRSLVKDQMVLVDSWIAPRVRFGRESTPRPVVAGGCSARTALVEPVGERRASGHAGEPVGSRSPTCPGALPANAALGHPFGSLRRPPRPRPGGAPTRAGVFPTMWATKGLAPCSSETPRRP